MKKILAFMLSALFLITPLCGCKQTSDAEESGENSGAEEEVFVLTKEALGSYSVVISEKADKETKTLAGQLCDKIKTVTESEVKTRSDFIVEGSDEYIEKEYEILFGYVDRDTAKEFYSDVREKDHGYAMVGKKILIVGYNAAALKSSVNKKFK